MGGESCTLQHCRTLLLSFAFLPSLIPHFIYARVGIRTRVEASTGLHDRPLHYPGLKYIPPPVFVRGEARYLASFVNAKHSRILANARHSQDFAERSSARQRGAKFHESREIRDFARHVKATLSPSFANAVPQARRAVAATLHFANVKALDRCGK